MTAPPAKVLIKRTATPDAPPTGLLPGELSVEMADPTRLWIGVPTAIDPSGKKLLVDRGAISNSAAIFIGDNPPSTPLVGQLWWESDTGYLYLYFDDGNTKQWVACSVQGPKGADGTNGINGISGAILTTVTATSSTSVTINTAPPTSGAVTEGVEILSTTIQVKSATSKLRLKGSACFSTTAALYGIACLYTNLSTAPVGTEQCYFSSNAAVSNPSPKSGLITHGQAVGTTITCSMRGNRSTTAGVIYANGNISGAAYVPPVNSWLEVEEIA